MIENLAKKMNRLTQFANTVAEDVCLELNVWVRPARRVEVEWSLWDGKTHFRGATIEEALRAAEFAHGLVKATMLDALIMPPPR